MVELTEIVNFQQWSHQLEPQVPVLHEKEVRIFNHDLTFSKDALYLTSQVHNVNIAWDEDMLGVPIEWIKSLNDESRSTKFLKHIGKLDDLNVKNVNKKSLKGGFHLLF